MLLLPSLYHVSYHAGHSFSQDELTRAPSKPILMPIQSPHRVSPSAGPVATQCPDPVFSAFTAKCHWVNGLFVCFAAQTLEKSGHWQLSALRASCSNIRPAQVAKACEGGAVLWGFLIQLQIVMGQLLFPAQTSAAQGGWKHLC